MRLRVKKPATLVRRLPFPYGAPPWPGAIEREPPERVTGIDYDTGWARRYPARVARLLFVEGVLRPFVRVVAAPERAGLDRLDGLGRQPVIFAANHHSHVDTPLLLTSIPAEWRHRVVVGAAADYFFTTRARAAASALGIAAVPIERRTVSRRSAELATELLGEGWSLLVFPEGGRSPDGWGQPFRGGAAYLSARTGRPVVPVHISGTGRILAKGQRRLRFGRAVVTFGAPLRPRPGEQTRAFASRIEAGVAALGDEATSDWWSARRRAASGTTPSLRGPDVDGWRRAWAAGGGGESTDRPWPLER